ncbi:MAG: sigma-54 dependent transcriptional regulator [Thioalkalispiraceae bacterium]|jgi:two-component system response regulator PilR (NtrC family)
MKKIKTALIVDDEPDIRELLDITLARMDIECKCAADLSESYELLKSGTFDLCLTDMRLPDGNGIELVNHIQQSYPELPVAMITAHGNMESAIEALKAGAFDFISKPVDLAILRNLISAALKLDTKTPERDDSGEVTELLGKSAAIEATRKKISKLARSQAPIYISGESGTGKELAARLIHDNGPRRDKPFVPVNCGAIPSELMESEFFGHKKGSFTGAVTNKQGLFQAADGGTLFLDEVADLPLSMQVKLLRAIQEKSIRPIGEQEEIPINVRILSATHKDLARLVEQGEFRQDLFYRINVIELHIPPLRERPEDIPILIEHFLNRIANEWQTDKPRLDKSAQDALQSYSFPGNVRELENILERAMTLYEGSTITEDDLQLPEISQSDSGTFLQPDEFALDSTLDEKERQVIVQALEKTRYNKTAAAKLLGISFRALRYRIKKLGIE